MQLNLLALYVSADNEWSSDMHDALADVDINDTEISSQFINNAPPSLISGFEYIGIIFNCGNSLSNVLIAAMSLSQSAFSGKVGRSSYTENATCNSQLSVEIGI